MCLCGVGEEQKDLCNVLEHSDSSMGVQIMMFESVAVPGETIPVWNEML